MRGKSAKAHVESVHVTNVILKQHKSRHLKTHVESTYKGVRYSCDQCNFKATQKRYLETHVESVHDEVRYSCVHCKYVLGQHSVCRHISLLK